MLLIRELARLAVQVVGLAARGRRLGVALLLVVIAVIVATTTAATTVAPVAIYPFL